ncbi:zinc ribbon domain-containing protein [Sphingomonas sp. BIUV-7]|uniref:Zinc ribbon domain-containing protein n=1 Tax=Sphingomonas natans TaxID=3063330 RepID=A0ABT8Y983_9SPHN|nr:zinc ribbon domain-containing protein [Sphingomonas sp. BIUV-7]MDO6414537.1 zinc ribbon domain-containing protein [Sphingomonas sp. BIUV-7]
MTILRTVLPQPTPETQHYWDGCAQSELRLQRCRACAQAYFPPRPVCPSCAARDIEIFAASGRATLHSYIINQRPRPDMGKDPHSIAVVLLEEGPKMMTNIIDCPQTPEALILDMPVEVVFIRQNDAITLPFFRPAQG